MTLAFASRLLVAADCNGNGVDDELDVAIGGTFRWLPAWFVPSGRTTAADAADFDGDGREEIIVSSGGTTRVAWIDETAGAVTRYEVELEIRPPGVADDLDGDGDIDYASLGAEHGELVLLENVDGASFVTRRASGFEARGAIVADDWDDDGDLDLASGSDGGVAVYENLGSLAFAPARILAVPTDEPATVTRIDADGDGDRDDLAALSSRLDILVASGGLNFDPHARVERVFGPSTRLLRSGDVDGDGRDDVIVLTSEGLVVYSVAKPDLSAIVEEIVPSWNSAVVGDFDGDGDDDVGLTREHSGFEIGVARPGCFVTFLGSAVEPLASRRYDIESIPFVRQIFTADVDGDGDRELVIEPYSWDAGYRGLEVHANVLSAVSKDCDGNAVPDECDVANLDQRAFLPDAIATCADCDGDGISDADEIAAGGAEDVNGDGVPDECAARPYTLRFRAPRVVEARPHSLARFEFTAVLSFESGAHPIGFWSVLLNADKGEFVDLHQEGTRWLEFERNPPPGQYVLQNLWQVESNCDVRVYAWFTMIPRGGEGDQWTFPDEPGAFDLLHATLEVPIEDEPVDVRLFVTPGVCDIHDIVTPGGGGTGRDSWACWVDETGSSHCAYLGIESATVRIVPTRASFRRGEANVDGTVDLSDAIFIFTYLFLGGARPTCLAAADANGDGHVDLSDGIQILEGLFDGGLDLPPPGHRNCGRTTSEAVGCERYDACG